MPPHILPANDTARMSTRDAFALSVARDVELGCPYAADDPRRTVWLEGYLRGHRRGLSVECVK